MKPATRIQTKKELQIPKIVRKVLLVCGILSSLLYIVTDILAAIQWDGYCSASQSVSELMAIGAPTRPFVIFLFGVYSVFVIAFGLGVRGVDTRRRTSRIAGVLLTGYGLAGYVTGLFFPMHLRGAVGTITDIMHITGTIVMSLFLILSIGFGSTAHGRWFHRYSIVTILVLLLFGAWAGLDGPRVAAQLPTPWLGIKERINIYTSMLWVLVFAVILLRAEKAKVN